MSKKQSTSRILTYLAQKDLSGGGTSTPSPCSPGKSSANIGVLQKVYTEIIKTTFWDNGQSKYKQQMQKQGKQFTHQWVVSYPLVTLYFCFSYTSNYKNFRTAP